MKLFCKDYVGKGGKLALNNQEIEVSMDGCAEVECEETCSMLMRFAGFKGAAQAEKEAEEKKKAEKELKEKIESAAKEKIKKDLEEAKKAEKEADVMKPAVMPEEEGMIKPAVMPEEEMVEEKKSRREKPAFLRNRGK